MSALKVLSLHGVMRGAAIGFVLAATGFAGGCLGNRSAATKQVQTQAPATTTDVEATDQTIAPETLEAAYVANDQAALGVWLASWAMADQALTFRQKILLPKIARDAYTIFEDFYDPVAERGEDGGHRYAVIQPSVEIAYHSVRHASEIGEGDKPFYRLEIKDFRPEVGGEHRTGLFFNGVHEKQLAHFLRRPDGTAPKDLAQRIAFLNPQLLGAKMASDPISYPHVTVIQFNADLTEARIVYHVQFKKSEVIYRKTGGAWRSVVVETTAGG